MWLLIVVQWEYVHVYNKYMHPCRYLLHAHLHSYGLAKGWKSGRPALGPFRPRLCFVLFWCGFNSHKNVLIFLIWHFNDHSLYKNYELAKTLLTCIYHSSAHADRVGYITNVISLSFCKSTALQIMAVAPTACGSDDIIYNFQIGEKVKKWFQELI